MSYHIHEHIGHHAHADLVVAPCLLQALEKLLASHPSLVGRCATQIRGVGQQVRGEQSLHRAVDLGAQPIVFKLTHAHVELLAFLFQHDPIGMAVQLFVRKARGIFGVDLAEGGGDDAPCFLKVNLIAVKALFTKRHRVS